LEDEANDGFPLADGEELGLFDRKLLGWDATTDRRSLMVRHLDLYMENCLVGMLD